MPSEGLEAVLHRGDDGLVGFALLDLFVNPLLDEDALQGAEVQFVFELLLLQLELTLQRVHELRRVLLEHLAHRHFHRPIVFDDDDAAGDGNFAIGERVKGIHKLFGAHATGRFDFDLDIFGGEIVDALHLDLAFARRVFDGSNERIGRGRRWDFFDDDRGIVPGFDFCSDLDATGAVLIFAGVHEPAGREIGQQFERLFLQDGNLRLEQLGKIVRQNLARHAHRDALGAEHQKQRQFRRQRDRLLVAPVVARHEFGQVIIEDFRAREFGEPALDVSGRGRRVAGENVAEVALAFDEIALVDQDDERVGNRRFAVRMILRAMAGDGRHFDEAPVVLLVQRPQDAPLHRLQAVGEIRNRAVADDVGGVLQEAGVHAPVQRQFDFRRLAVAGSGEPRLCLSNDFSFFLRCAHVVAGF